jgi:hypothetical protein
MAARRCASLEAELVHLEDGFAKARECGADPEAAQLDLYSRLSTTQPRLAESLGWERTARDVPPNLSEYLRAKATETGADVSAATEETETPPVPPKTVSNDMRAQADE